MTDINTEKVKLQKNMIARASELISVIKPTSVPIDGFDKLTSTIPSTGNIDNMNADIITMTCLQIIDKAREYAAVCQAFRDESKRQRKASYAKSTLVTSKSWLAENSFKDTDKNKQSYADMDVEVLEWYDKENAWGALYNYFENLRQDVTLKFYWFKKVYELRSQMDMGMEPTD